MRLRPNGAGPILFICDHASNAIPDVHANLGLSAEQRADHIAWDPGAAGVTKARTVYQNGIDTAFVRARAMLLEGDGRLAMCMRELSMKMPAHELASRIERLEFIDSPRW